MSTPRGVDTPRSFFEVSRVHGGVLHYCVDATFVQGGGGISPNYEVNEVGCSGRRALTHSASLKQVQDLPLIEPLIV